MSDMPGLQLNLESHLLCFTSRCSAVCVAEVLILLPKCGKHARSANGKLASRKRFSQVVGVVVVRDGNSVPTLFSPRNCRKDVAAGEGSHHEKSGLSGAPCSSQSFCFSCRFVVRFLWLQSFKAMDLI